METQSAVGLGAGGFAHERSAPAATPRLLQRTLGSGSGGAPGYPTSTQPPGPRLLAQQQQQLVRQRSSASPVKSPVDPYPAASSPLHLQASVAPPPFSVAIQHSKNSYDPTLTTTAAGPSYPAASDDDPTHLNIPLRCMI